MEESKKIFVVGKKPNKLFILLNTIIPLIISLVIGTVYVKYLDLRYYTVILIVITFLLILVLYIPIIVSGKNYWNINEQYLEYYPVSDYLHQLKHVLSIFTGKDHMFIFKIKLTEIKSIKLVWETIPVYNSSSIHVYFFRITLKDGSIITFQSSFNTSDKEYIDAFNYLKNKFNIQIEDEYNLITALEKQEVSLNAYIDEIERQLNERGQKDD